MKLWLMSASYQLPRLALPWLIAFNWLLQHQDLHVRQCKRCGISLPRRFPSMRTGRMRLQRVKQVIARCSMRVWLVPIQLLFKLNCRYILWLILRRIVIHMWFALYNCFLDYDVFICHHWSTCAFSHARLPWSPIILSVRSCCKSSSSSFWALKCPWINTSQYM